MRKNISTPLIYFNKYGALCLSTSYCFQNIGPYPKIYSITCNNEDKMRSKNTEKGRRCNSCQVIFKSSMIKTIQKVVHKRGDNYHRAEAILCSRIVTYNDAISIVNFSQTWLKDLNKTGQLLRLFIVNSLDFYKKLKNMKTKNWNQATDSLSLPGTDIFINKFIEMYKYKYNGGFKSSLVVCLL